jgi:hypothetical protein
MYYSPIQVGLIIVIILCMAGWMVILIRDVSKIVKRADGKLTTAEINNLIWLVTIGTIAFASYLVFKEI